jgi:hypothetical protein
MEYDYRKIYEQTITPTTHITYYVLKENDYIIDPEIFKILPSVKMNTEGIR